MSYMSESERKNPIVYTGSHCKIKTCYDLSEGINIIPHTKGKVLLGGIMRDLMSFTAQWVYFDRPKLNGFPGMQGIKITIEKHPELSSQNES